MDNRDSTWQKWKKKTSRASRPRKITQSLWTSIKSPFDSTPPSSPEQTRNVPSWRNRTSRDKRGMHPSASAILRWSDPEEVEHPIDETPPASPMGFGSFQSPPSDHGEAPPDSIPTKTEEEAADDLAQEIMCEYPDDYVFPRMVDRENHATDTVLPDGDSEIIPVPAEPGLEPRSSSVVAMKTKRDHEDAPTTPLKAASPVPSLCSSSVYSQDGIFGYQSMSSFERQSIHSMVDDEGECDNPLNMPEGNMISIPASPRQQSIRSSSLDGKHRSAPHQDSDGNPGGRQSDLQASASPRRHRRPVAGVYAYDNLNKRYRFLGGRQRLKSGC